MVNFTILAGGYSMFVATYIFNSDASTLSLVKQTMTGENPSWIALHPQNSSILYAVNEVSPVGSLQSFLVDDSGGLELVDTVSTGGNGPTFTNPLSTGEVTAMNFGSPNVSLVATVPGDPLHFERDSPVVNLPVNGGPSHPHMSLEHNGEVFVSDLGADKIWRLVSDGTPGDFRVQGSIDVAPGNGPRHMAIHDGILFVINELTSTLTAQQIPGPPNGTTFPLLANVSIIPPENQALVQDGKATFAGAEIIISQPSTSFPDALIYVSNRNLGPTFDPRADAIAIFEYKNSTAQSAASPQRRSHVREWPLPLRRQQAPNNDGDGASGLPDVYPINTFNATLTLQNHVFTGLRQIRGMAIGRVEDGGEEFVVAGGNLDGGVAVFRRVDGGRNLTLVARNGDVENRSSFVFV